MRNPLSKLTTFFCIVMFVVLASACGGPSSTPTQTLTDYCSGLKNADYQTAYNQFSNGIKELSESQYAALLKLYGKVTNCTPSNVNDSSGSGTINLSFANLGNVVFDYTLVNDNGTWKIKNQTARSTPSHTLNLYCLALKTGDYQSAYGQLASTIRSQLTKDQFVAAGSENGTRTVASCMVRNVDDSAGTGTVTITASNGLVSSQNYALTQENGTWKISALTSIATETLNNFCSALMSEDYQSAFSDLSSTAQSQVGSADQFASSFSSNKVKDCTVSNADDSAGTGTISYTYADGSTQVFNYTLVNQNNDWLIDSAQQAQ